MSEVASVKWSTVLMSLPLDGMRGSPAFPMEASNSPRPRIATILGVLISGGQEASFVSFAPLHHLPCLGQDPVAVPSPPPLMSSMTLSKALCLSLNSFCHTCKPYLPSLSHSSLQ